MRIATRTDGCAPPPAHRPSSLVTVCRAPDHGLSSSMGYGSQALDHIGTVLEPTSGAKGTVPLSTQEPRRGAESQMWALFGPDPLLSPEHVE